MSRHNILLSLIRLGKLPIALPVTFSGLTGYLLCSTAITSAMIQPLTGLMFTALGAMALNQYQERHYDALMPRTRHRPIPAGVITPEMALLFAIAMLITGLILLSSQTIPTILALLTIILYNAIYTPLKRHTIWAVLPGALVGALPPTIGYTAAGGTISNPAIISLALFFFIGQVPHFWLLMLHYGQEYHHAGLPAITSTLGTHRVKRLIFIWLTATLTSALLLPVFLFIQHPLLRIAIPASAALLIFASLPITQHPLKPFAGINIFFLTIMFIIIISSLS